MNQLASQVQELEIHLDNKELEILYEPVNENSMFDLCSLEGRILVTGKLEFREENRVDLSGFPEGAYNLFILDGEQVFKTSFRI